MEIQNTLETPAFTPPETPSVNPPELVTSPLGGSEVATADALAPIEGDKGTLFNSTA